MSLRNQEGWHSEGLIGRLGWGQLPLWCIVTPSRENKCAFLIQVCLQVVLCEMRSSRCPLGDAHCYWKAYWMVCYFAHLGWGGPTPFSWFTMISVIPFCCSVSWSCRCWLQKTVRQKSKCDHFFVVNDLENVPYMQHDVQAWYVNVNGRLHPQLIAWYTMNDVHYWVCCSWKFYMIVIYLVHSWCLLLVA